MTRTPASWSPFVDLVEGPCVVCAQTVRFVIPKDRSDPALIHHATCNPMTILRSQLKDVKPPPLPDDQTIKGQKQKA